jgi:hypothetical protein
MKTGLFYNNPQDILHDLIVAYKPPFMVSLMKNWTRNTLIRSRWAAQDALSSDEIVKKKKK